MEIVVFHYMLKTVRGEKFPRVAHEIFRVREGKTVTREPEGDSCHNYIEKVLN
jgi:hypothetical protein